MFVAGNIIEWSPIPGKPGKPWRVVQAWEDEPKRLLVTDPEGVTMRCDVALQCDCILLAKGEEPRVSYKRSSDSQPVNSVPPQANDQI
jgi:hypothetical protein